VLRKPVPLAARAPGDRDCAVWDCAVWDCPDRDCSDEDFGDEPG
jgi:hypothetical protein